MKKNFLLSYEPAQVKENKRWYIEFYQFNPSINQKQRFREYHNLNRIKKMSLRRKKAQELVNQINSLLPFGYPFMESENDHDNPLSSIPILEALQKTYEIKMTSDRKNTRRTIQSTWNIFTDWLKRERLDKITIGQFLPRHAKQYMDYALIERKVNNTTYNNYLRNTNLFFNELVRGEYIDKNPFRKIRRRKRNEPHRRRFTDHERQVISKYLYENDIWMFYAILLQYYCYIRPVELIRLKKSHFLIGKQLIHLPPEITKTKNTRYVTIPDSIIRFFKHHRFESISYHYYVFAKGICPGKIPYDKEDKMYKKHRKVLNHLLRVGELENIDKLVWYSWKYTGIKNARREMDLDKISEQAGHATLDQTREYFLNDVDEVNLAVKDRSFDMLGE